MHLLLLVKDIATLAALIAAVYYLAFGMLVWAMWVTAKAVAAWDRLKARRRARRTAKDRITVAKPLRPVQGMRVSVRDTLAKVPRVKVVPGPGAAASPA